MLKVPTKFLARLREPLDWVDLRFAYEKQIVDGQTLIDHACRILSETECDNDAILALASASKSDELMPLIEKVAGPIEASPNRPQKWALILAAAISESDIKDKLEAVENIYSSFDYPEELAEFVRYMPMKGPDLGSKEANEARMLKSLRELSTQVVTKA